MEYYILKRTKKVGLIQPEDLLVLNEEGAVKIFTNLGEAWDFIEDNNLGIADVLVVR